MTEFAYRTTMEALAPGVDVDPAIYPALWLIEREPEFRYLSDAIAESRTPIRVAPLGDASLIASFSFTDRAITISDRYADGDIRVVAVALAHEATHAWEAGQGLRLNNLSDCFEAELRAFRNQAALWERFYGPKGKEKAATTAEQEQNEVLRLIREDPEALKTRLVGRYGDECGYQGPLPPGAPAPGTPLVGTSVAGTPVAGTPRPAGTPAPASAVTATAGATAPSKPPSLAKPSGATPQPKLATP
jgi:hypothetical protein